MDIWTQSDFENGLISDAALIGKPLTGLPPIEQPTGTPQSAPPVEQETFTALSREDRKRMTQELSDKLLIMAHNNPAAFMDNAGPQINKFIDAAQKLSEDERVPVFDENTIKQMSTADLKRYLLRNMSESLTAEIKAEFGGK